jgi:hypothetical protein
MLSEKLRERWQGNTGLFFYPPELSVLVPDYMTHVHHKPFRLHTLSSFSEKILVPCIAVLHLNGCDDFGKSFGNYQFVQPLYMGVRTENYNVEIRTTYPKVFAGVKRIG